MASFVASSDGTRMRILGGFFMRRMRHRLAIPVAWFPTAVSSARSIWASRADISCIRFSKSSSAFLCPATASMSVRIAAACMSRLSKSAA